MFMIKIDAEIINIDKVICSNIDKLDKIDRGLLSQNILSQLRNLIEHISIKTYSRGQDIEITYTNISKAIDYVKSKGDLNFLYKFHKFLQITASHYTLDEENSERLMLKYYEYLLKIKIYSQTILGLEILNNINAFPINNDSAMKEYYEKIVKVINKPITAKKSNYYTYRYYIQKIKPFFVEYKVYYEITFTTANDKSSKFDRIIAFTKLNIPHNYAVKLSIRNDEIPIFGKKMPIQIIDYWEVSIRPCELNNFAKFFCSNSEIQSGSQEYRNLMEFLTKTGLNLAELIDSAEDYYQSIINNLTQGLKTIHFLGVLDKCRELSKSNKSGSNLIRYLLYRMNNKVIKRQYGKGECEKLSNLQFDYGCIPFDQMPFNSSLKNHNPKISDLFDCIGPNSREQEIFARLIKNNTESKGQLYTSKQEIDCFVNIDDLIKLYNSSLYYKHTSRKLYNYKDNIYIKGYEEDTLRIIEKLKNLSLAGIENYSNSFDSWLQTFSYCIDCPEKEVVLRQMFENSKVALIYGSAGTGKSTIINHISNFFKDNDKLYLANTNPAVDNLKRRVNAANCTFKTIAKFLSKMDYTEYHLLVVDECSTVSNSNMLEVLTKASFKLLVLVGDVYQIESILFGNWFNIAQSFVPNKSIFELTKPYRSNNQKLLLLWNKVRNMDDDILEHIAKNNYSITLNESIFESSEKDEIILCLNYDGLYGINNLNRFLQSNNKSNAVQWGIHTYKINDPILFDGSDKFAPLIYNNLKGIIVGIELFENEIQFDIEINKAINQLDAEGYDFQLMGHSDSGNSIIRFKVQKYGNTDEDDDSSSNAVIPFQVAYAVSIHKAQGLEYNSVKVVITDEIEEMITHNIFYTAITRAKEQLKIYWTPETENKVLKSLKKRNNRRDVSILSSKFNL